MQFKVFDMGVWYVGWYAIFPTGREGSSSGTDVAVALLLRSSDAVSRVEQREGGGEVSLSALQPELLPDSNTTMATPSPDNNSAGSGNSGRVVGSTSHQLHQNTLGSGMQGGRPQPGTSVSTGEPAASEDM